MEPWLTQSRFFFLETRFLVYEQVIKKSILLSYFRDSRKRNFYIRDPWSSIFFSVYEPCQRPPCTALFVLFSVEFNVIKLSIAFVYVQVLSITTVSELLSAGLIIMSCPKRVKTTLQKSHNILINSHELTDVRVSRFLLFFFSFLAWVYPRRKESVLIYLTLDILTML